MSLQPGVVALQPWQCPPVVQQGTLSNTEPAGLAQHPLLPEPQPQAGPEPPQPPQALPPPQHMLQWPQVPPHPPPWQPPPQQRLQGIRQSSMRTTRFEKQMGCNGPQGRVVGL